MKPVLVTRVTETELEVLTDYQTVIVSVGHSLTLSRGSQRSGSEDGLIGAIWTISGDIPTDGLINIVVKHYKGEGGEHEYIFKV